MFRRPSQRNKKKDDKVVVTIGNTVCGRTESLQWTNTAIPGSKSSANFLNETVSPISMDSPEFIRALIISSISIGKSARGTLWRWNLTRSSPEQILSMLSNCRKDRSLYLPMNLISNDTKLSELDLIDFPSLSPSSSAYLNKWMAFERSGSNGLLAFIGIETAQKILQLTSIAIDSDELVDVSILLQGAIILGAILTTRRSEMLLSMSFSIWTLMQVAHSQIHDIGFEKKRLWRILNGLTTKGGHLCGLNQLSKFLDLSLPGKMKREDKQTLVNSLRDILLTRIEEEEAPNKQISKRYKKHMLKPVKIEEEDEEGVGKREEPLSSPRSYDKEADSVRVKKMKGRPSVKKLEERGALNILSSSRTSSSLRERMYSLSPPKIDRFSPELTPAPLSSPRSYDKEADSVRVKKMKGRTSVEKLEERGALNIRSSSSTSSSLRERIYSLSPPKIDRISPEKTHNDLDGFVSSRDGDYFTPLVSSSRFDYLSVTREETPHGNGNQERKKKMGRKRRSDNWRRIEEVSQGGSPKGSTSNGDDHDPMPKRRRGFYSAKPAGNEILGMFYELRMKTEEEWEREMEVVSRPMRAKRPVKLFDPTPMTPKKRSSSRVKIEQSDLDVDSIEKMGEGNADGDQIDNSEDDEYDGRKEREDADYEIENIRRRSRDDRMDVNQGMTPGDGEHVVRPHSREKEIRPRTIRNKTPIWKELPMKMPPLINVNGFIQLGERTEEAVEEMIEDERRMEERNENDNDNDDLGIEIIRYSGPLDEHSYARILDGDTMDEEIVDVVTVDGLVDLRQNGNNFEMDEDVEEIHEIIGEDGGEEDVIPTMEENVNEVNDKDPQMDMDEYLAE